MDRWQELQPRLRQLVGEEDYATWLDRIRPVTDTSEGLMLRADNSIVAEWVRDHVLRDIEAVARSEWGPAFRVTLDDSSGPHGPAPGEPTSEAPGHLNLAFTFQRFVTGPSNQFACAAAEAVADRPGTAYNPLYLYGGSGLGKTHLLHAIAHRVRSARPRLKVVYMTIEQ